MVLEFSLCLLMLVYQCRYGFLRFVGYIRAGSLSSVIGAANVLTKKDEWSLDWEKG